MMSYALNSTVAYGNDPKNNGENMRKVVARISISGALSIMSGIAIDSCIKKSWKIA